MSKVCQKCGKKPSTGSNISHSHRRTKRTYSPNLQTKKVFDTQSGTFSRVKICTSCVRTMAKKQNAA